jgi:hypothetical protein
MQLMNLSNKKYLYMKEDHQTLCSSKINSSVQTEDQLQQDDKKVLDTYELMLKSASRLICKTCGIKMRPEKFYDHIRQMS